MKTGNLSLNTPCPACQSELSLKALGCDRCGCEVKGAISLSPLAKLDSEMTHFLMVFIHSGGKIGDVEKALGISYPTVKAKLSKLQSLLFLDEITKEETPENQVIDLLAKLESGEMGYEEVMNKVKKLKEKQ